MNDSPGLKEGVDYYLNEQGLLVFTEHYLLERGYCCNNGCRHCPYGYSPFKEKKQKESDPQTESDQRDKWQDA